MANTAKMIDTATSGIVGLWCVPVTGSPFLFSFDGAAGKLVCGRDPSCDLVISDDKLLSEAHFEIHLSGTGPERRAMIADCKSTNGTRVGGLRVTRPTELEDGVEIVAGRSTFTPVTAELRLPISATTYTSFLAHASKKHGSSRAAAEAIHRGRSTVQRGIRRFKQRSRQSATTDKKDKK